MHVARNLECLKSTYGFVRVSLLVAQGGAWQRQAYQTTAYSRALPRTAGTVAAGDVARDCRLRF